MKFIFLVMILSIFGCSKFESPGSSKNIVGPQFAKEKLFFEDGYPKFIAMLQLKEPALLEALIIKDGRKVIDKNLLEKIDKEQAELIEKLNSISPDIQVLYTYKRVLNGITIVAPRKFADEISKINGILSYESDQQFDRPKMHNPTSVGQFAANIKVKNSVAYIKATEVHNTITVKEGVIKDGEDKVIEVPVDGRGITVGIIDTGIDYTHKMLGGNGSIADYKAIDPSKETKFFPNDKVIGGKDFVGKDFSVSSIYFEKFIPKEDVNPIDYGGHGTHVGGTVAGIGDGLKTYSGVAPQASLYALKVFGDEDGSTADSIVIAAFEYAVDPDGDFNLDDSIEVLNLSLGSGYGTPHHFYNYAITNLVNYGTAIVASAGNSGDINYITGSPGASDDAFSVAAGIDDMEHNWKTDSVLFASSSLDKKIKVRAYEASFSKKISEINDDGISVVGQLVYAGDAKEDFPDELKAKINGNIALIDRGVVSFTDKFKRAQQAGAIAVVIANNKEGDAFVMGGDDKEFKFKIVGVMIDKATGEKIKTLIKNEEVIADFTSKEIVEFPEVIGTITGFSSKGPRSLDSILKPEITAPGQQIISASAGSGDKAVRLGGTSMSAPHIAGVMALMRQKHRSLPARDLKSMVMASAQDMYFDSKDGPSVLSSVYPLSRQGAGMVNTYKAVTSQLAFFPVALSLGEHSIIQTKSLSKLLQVKNITDEVLSLGMSYSGDNDIKVLNLPSSIDLNPKSTEELKLKIKIAVNEKTKFELNGFINFKIGNEIISRVPVMAIIDQASNVVVTDFEHKTSVDKLKSNLAEIRLKNSSKFMGKVYPFNLLSLDDRKPNSTITKLSTCDLQAVGFKYLVKELPVADGKTQKVNTMQFGVKLFNPLTDWHQCLVSIEFDTNLDGKANYLLLGGRLDRMPLQGGSPAYGSILIDNKIREKLVAQNIKDNLGNSTSKGIGLDLSKAVVGQMGAKPFQHSTINILEMDTKLVSLGAKTAVRVSISNVYGNDVEVTDTLVGGTDAWYYMGIKDKKESYSQLPEEVTINSNESGLFGLKLEDGSSRNPILLLMPTNKFTFSRTQLDKQLLLVKP